MNPSPAHQTLPLVTERLRVRLWTEADRAALRRMNADPRVMKFFPSTLSEAESDALLARIQAHQAEHGFTLWAVEDKATGNLAGLTGLARVAFDAPFTPCVEIGWRLARRHWGKGYITEAAERLLAFGFTEKNLGEIVSFAVAGNTRSIAVMQRIGMIAAPERDFNMPGIEDAHAALRPHVLYTLDRATWQQKGR